MIDNQSFILPVAAGVTAIAVAPVIISAVGFTSAGIATGSIAAKMMSAAALANGGGVAAGSTVAVCQSVGVAGTALTTKFALAGGFGAAVTGVQRMWNRKP